MKKQIKAAMLCGVALGLGLLAVEVTGCRSGTEIRVQNPVDRLDIHLQPPVLKHRSRWAPLPNPEPAEKVEKSKKVDKVWNGIPEGMTYPDELDGHSPF